MKQHQIIALVCAILAAGLIYMGYNESQSVSGRLTSALSGKMDETVIAYYVGGAICVALAFFFFQKK